LRDTYNKKKSEQLLKRSGDGLEDVEIEVTWPWFTKLGFLSDVKSNVKLVFFVTKAYVAFTIFVTIVLDFNYRTVDSFGTFSVPVYDDEKEASSHLHPEGLVQTCLRLTYIQNTRLFHLFRMTSKLL